MPLLSKPWQSADSQMFLLISPSVSREHSHLVGARHGLRRAFPPCLLIPVSIHLIRALLIPCAQRRPGTISPHTYPCRRHPVQPALAGICEGLLQWLSTPREGGSGHLPPSKQEDPSGQVEHSRGERLRQEASSGPGKGLHVSFRTPEVTVSLSTVSVFGPQEGR